MVARSLGMKTKAELSPTQRKYAERIAQSLAEARAPLSRARGFFLLSSSSGLAPPSALPGSRSSLPSRFVLAWKSSAADRAAQPPPFPPSPHRQKAAAMAKKQAEEKKVLLAGQHFFEIGQYANAVEVFEKVLPEVGERTNLGGEARGHRTPDSPPPACSLWIGLVNVIAMRAALVAARRGMKPRSLRLPVSLPECLRPPPLRFRCCCPCLPQCALWLALAYDAAGRRDDALDVYRRLENTHPSAVRRRPLPPSPMRCLLLSVLLIHTPCGSTSPLWLTRSPPPRTHNTKHNRR